MPGEVYCHSLTDPSILGSARRRHAHPHLLRPAHPGLALRAATRRTTKASRSRRALASLNEHLAEPIETCWPATPTGQPCIEAKIPQDIEADLAMPGGHIFHGDLDWPWAPNRARLDTPAQQWGVQTDVASRCSSAAPAPAAAAPSRASAATTPRRPFSPSGRGSSRFSGAHARW